MERTIANSFLDRLRGRGDLRPKKIGPEEWCHVNRKGEPIYKQRYEYVSRYNRDRIARVKENGLWFHIDINGKPLYDARFDYVSDYIEGIAVAKLDGDWCRICKKGQVLSI